jgi:hypothetical protein
VSKRRTGTRDSAPFQATRSHLKKLPPARSQVESRK